VKNSHIRESKGREVAGGWPRDKKPTRKRNLEKRKADEGGESHQDKKKETTKKRKLVRDRKGGGKSVGLEREGDFKGE